MKKTKINSSKMEGSDMKSPYFFCYCSRILKYNSKKLIRLKMVKNF